MHGHKNNKLCDAKQVYHYKESSLKLCTYKPPRTLIESDSTICCMCTTVSS